MKTLIVIVFKAAFRAPGIQLISPQFRMRLMS